MKHIGHNTLALAASLLFALTACRPGAEDYLEFLYTYMPEQDRTAYSQEFWKANVDKTLEVRDRMGWDVPEREFRHFVLPLRVNNEALDDFRTLYADTLCARVSGMSMAEAALEINHWCHEQATYVPADARTLGPMGLMLRGVGRCGEESVLAVSAMRAAGIPARQVYTPRWAHTDDNHAWVEVFVDGGWHFMGACEPEPVLDLAWFNAPASRAMLLHTNAFGDYDGPEDVIRRTSHFTEINVNRSYLPTRRTVVTVLDTDGNPVPGAFVEFKIYNYAEFYTVARYQADDKGTTALDTGIGDIVIWASDGDRFGLTTVGGGCPDGVAEGTVTLDHRFGEDCCIELDIVPPVEKPLPGMATPEQAAANAIRLAREDSIRASHHHVMDRDSVIAIVCPGYDYAKGIKDSDATAEVRTPEASGSIHTHYIQDGSPVRNPEYYRHFTLSRIDGGTAHLYEYDENAPTVYDFDLESGYYMITTGTRMADGSVLARAQFFTLEPEGEAEVPIVLRAATDRPQVIGNIDAEQLFLPEGAEKQQSLLSATGRGYFLLAVLGGKDEPTNHAIHELESIQDDLAIWGRKCVVLAGPAGSTHSEELASLPGAVFGADPDAKVMEMLRSGVEAPAAILPLVAVCDSFGRVVWFSQGYNTSLGGQLKAVVAQL